MVLSQHMSQFELLDLGNLGSSGYTARFAAPHKRCDRDKQLINQTLVKERPVQRGSTPVSYTHLTLPTILLV